MIEEIKKVKDEPGSASEPKDIKEFVEVNGKKFVANPKTPNIPLLNENGDPVPFIPKGKDGGDIDYKTKLEQAESTISKRDESLRKAGYTIQNLEKGQKESLSQEEIKQMIDAKVGDVYAKISTQSAKDLAYKMSGSVDEAKLVLFHYKNSVVKTGKLDLDMSNAYAIANKDKGAKTIEEIQRSLDAKKLLGKETGVGGKRIVTDKARPNLNPTEENLVSSTGLIWDTKEGMWKGKSGKLYKHLAQGEGTSAVEGPGQGK